MSRAGEIRIFSRGPKGVAARYSLAVLATGLSLACRAALDPILGSYVPYSAIFPAVIFSAWYCGLWPSVVSVIIAFLGETYWFVEPRHSLMLSYPAYLLAAFVYIVAAVFIIVMAESSRLAMTEARTLHQKLNGLVKERTSELEARNADLMEQTEKVRALSSRLLTMRDEERRHIARELHDSVGQLAVVMKMNLAKVIPESQALSEPAAKALTENVSLLDQLITEVRTLSYLLHPPLLDALGLQSALQWFVEGFAERSKIDVRLDLPTVGRRLSPDLEIHLFRIAQECLTNIYRHSGSPTALVLLVLSESHVRLEVEDAGKGIPQEKLKTLESRGQFGVGIRGMRERVRQFGGTIDIKSNSKGTTVVTIIPIASGQPDGASASECASDVSLGSGTNGMHSREATAG